MKTYLSFNDQSEDDRAKLKDVLKATDMALALFDIQQDIFRPNRKHGYGNNDRLNELLKNEEVSEAICLLEDMFNQILIDRDVDVG